MVYLKVHCFLFVGFYDVIPGVAMGTIQFLDRVMKSNLIILAFMLLSCENQDAAFYAKKFCNCSKSYSDAEVRKNSDLISKEEYEIILQKHRACMGNDNPLKNIYKDPDAYKNFRIEFIEGIQRECPEIAKNLNYK